MSQQGRIQAIILSTP